MKSLKKFLALFVVVAFVLSTMSVAFASTTAPAKDIADKDIKAAVEELSAFGIVAGKEDGKYHESDSLTRDEFAKMVVLSLDLGNAANAAKGATKFADVKSTDWSSGFVNVATGKGIIKGRPDGKFGRLDPVTAEEAITMLVRSVGYKDAWLDGSWPENMVGKADEIGMLDDLSNISGPINRGQAALLVKNALDCVIVKQTGYGSDAEYAEDEHGATLMSSKLNIDTIEYDEDAGVDAIVTDVPRTDDGLKTDEIAIDGDSYKVVEEGVSLDTLLNKEVKAYVNSDDEIVYISVATDASDIIVGEITAVDNAADNTLTIQLADGTDDDYTIEDAPTVFVNSESDNTLNNANLTAGDVGLYGTFILNDEGNIEKADLYDFGATHPLIVTEVNAAKEVVNGIRYVDDSSKVEFGKEDGYKIFKNGAEIAIGDIKADDMVYSVNVPYNGDTYTFGFVVTNTVSGKLTRVKNDEFTIGGNKYPVADAGDVAVSLDEGDEISAFVNSADLTDAIDSDVKAYLDLKGAVRYVVTAAESTSDTIYGVAMKSEFTVSGDDAVKVYTKDDKEVTYTFDGDMIGHYNQYDYVSFELTSDGLIDPDTFHAYNPTAVDRSVSDFDEDNDTMTVGGLTYYVNSDTVIMQLDNEDTSVVDWATIKDKTPGGTLMADIESDGRDLKYVLFSAGYDLSSDAYSAFVNGDPYEDVDGVKVDVTLSDGTDASYVIADADDAQDAVDNFFKDGDFIVFDTNQDGDIDKFDIAVTDATYSAVDTATYMVDGGHIGDYLTYAGDIDEYSSSSKRLAIGDEFFRILSTTQVYRLTLDDDNVYDSAELGDTSDLTEDSRAVVVYTEDSDGIREVQMVIVYQD